MSTGRSGGLKAMDKTSGYADVNGLHMYYEVQGEGSPLVLLHGGVQSIDLSFAGLIPELVGRHRVIGVELQGHGRTADIERDSTPAALAGDVVALLDHLGIDRAHMLGFSLGAAVTLELAVSHPDRVRSVVPISEPVRPEGMHEDLKDPSRYATSTRMPTAQDFADMQETYARLSPHPEPRDGADQVPVRRMPPPRGVPCPGGRISLSRHLGSVAPERRQILPDAAPTDPG